MLIEVVVTLVVLGVILFLINNYLPMDGRIKQLINIVAVVGAVLYVLRAFGIMGMGGPLMTLIIALCIIGVLLWAINTYVPMDGKIKSIVNIVILLVAILGVLQAFGMLPGHMALR